MLLFWISIVLINNIYTVFFLPLFAWVWVCSFFFWHPWIQPAFCMSAAWAHRGSYLSIFSHFSLSLSSALTITYRYSSCCPVGSCRFLTYSGAPSRNHLIMGDTVSGLQTRMSKTRRHADWWRDTHRKTIRLTNQRGVVAVFFVFFREERESWRESHAGNGNVLPVSKLWHTSK